MNVVVRLETGDHGFGDAVVPLVANVTVVFKLERIGPGVGIAALAEDGDEAREVVALAVVHSPVRMPRHGDLQRRAQKTAVTMRFAFRAAAHRIGDVVENLCLNIQQNTLKNSFTGLNSVNCTNVKRSPNQLKYIMST